MEIEKIAKEIELLDTFPKSGISWKYADKVLSCEPASFEECKLIFDCLIELLWKLTENYDCFSSKQEAKIISLAEQNWSYTDIEYMDVVLTVVLNCDANLAMKLIEDKVGKTNDSVYEDLVIEAITELKESMAWQQES